jgi:hypothetical protein
LAITKNSIAGTCPDSSMVARAGGATLVILSLLGSSPFWAIKPSITFGVKLPAPLPNVRPSSCLGCVTLAPLLKLKIAYGAF